MPAPKHYGNYICAIVDLQIPNHNTTMTAFCKFTTFSTVILYGVILLYEIAHYIYLSQAEEVSAILLLFDIFSVQ